MQPQAGDDVVGEDEPDDELCQVIPEVGGTLVVSPSHYLREVSMSVQVCRHI